MAVTGTTQLARNLAATQIIKQLNSQLNTQNAQLSSGLKSNGLVGVASQAQELGWLKNQLSASSAYQSGTTTVQNRVSLYTVSMERIIDIATEAMDLMIKNRDTTFAATSAPASQANALLDQIGSALLVKDGDRYLFSGGNYGDAPISGQLSSIPTQYAAGAVPGDTGYDDPLSVATDAASSPQPPYLNSAAASQDNFYDTDGIALYVDDNERVSYGIAATDPGIQQVIDALVRFRDATADISGDPANYQTRVDDALKQLRTSITSLQTTASENGYVQQRLTEVQSRHASNTDLLKKRIAGIQEADVAEVSVNIKSLQASLEATYAVLSDSFSLSLVNYLK
ncbi:flagellin [Ferrovibrio sp.]|uniref:flagellin n=1 Tax=Ferrovibrio sp. TaxID=1917215 RepID=UPI0025BD63C9|nr:flagellin [Ferrovibrio sp.]MBX3453532.1 hypothetical protein [Ferrovibrio sp.]